MKITYSERNSIARGILCALALTLLAPSLCLRAGEEKSEIPSALALKLDRIRKALPPHKLSHISGWATRRQRRYLLYVEEIAKFPSKLWGEDTVQKLIPSVDYAVVQAWPMEDQIRAAHYFKEKRKDDEPVSLQQLDRETAELPPDERATVRLMLPTDQKGYLSVRARMKAKKAAARPAPRRKRPVPAPSSSHTGKPEAANQGKGVSGTAVTGVIALIVVVAALVAVFRPRKKPSPDTPE